jgi:hypothetical protein
MWNLDDERAYFRLPPMTILRAYTWGDHDRDKRESIRRAVAPDFPSEVPRARWWAFRLYARKGGDGWDIENIPKLVVDAFCGEQIVKDRSAYPQLQLYEKDTIEFVRMVQVAGEQSSRGDSTVIEIFGARQVVTT